MIILALWSLLSGAVARAQPITFPRGGADVVAFGQDEPLRFRTKGIEATGAWTPIEGMPFREAYRVESGTRITDRKNVQVTIPIREPVRKGDVLLLSFWTRRPNAGGQPNNVYFCIDPGSAPHGFEYQLSAYREWKQHVRSFVTRQDLDPDSSSVHIDLGEAGTVAEVADLRLINYGPDRAPDTLPRSTVVYRGRAADSAWRAEALDRIERIRKGALVVRVVDAQGDPIPNASVTVVQQRHAFGFGAAVNSEVLGAKESDFPVQPKGKLSVTWEDAQRYREVVRKYFNRVVFESELRPGNWALMRRGQPGWVRRHDILMNSTLPWLNANRIAARGHYLGWAPMDFNEVEKPFLGDPQAHKAWLWGHMADVLPETAGYVAEWDAINHIVGWGKHTYEQEYGGLEIYAEILAEARRLAPGAAHAINEGKVLPDGYKREPYKRIIRFLNEEGQAPDLVGFMAHFDLSTLTPPEELLEVYDDFAKIAPRLQLSELDVEVGDDEALQADYYRDVLIATFSHPNIEAIVQWGFWEPMHWKPAAALWRDDWTLKPAGEVFVDLVAGQWWTNEELTTNRQGKCRLRGFLGDYRVTARHDGVASTKEVALRREGSKLLIQLE
ncbi:Endo-1,4-beta-xylanase Z precursor [Pirellulimonas nuda]|uniref:endo-1,4-beta-xylanase n=2 Tax=Pirellulimonas nuda TaxID=2528009 RepID=A0A518DBV9_9BACT|nr:Endo-1,4-beta-xylanase Z precursor [Pirellulimonas nuda]